MPEYHVTTKRIGLRRFSRYDLDTFADLNSDPRVMQHFPNILSRTECQDLMERINHTIDQDGFGFWAAENLNSGQLMGMVGLNRVKFEAAFTPAVEIGWRLAYPCWGHGLATEAARACLEFGFRRASLREIVSFTSLHNIRSQRLMQKLGMTTSGEFDHPMLPDGHRLQRHVLYRILRPGADEGESNSCRATKGAS